MLQQEEELSKEKEQELKLINDHAAKRRRS